MNHPDMPDPEGSVLQDKEGAEVEPGAPFSEETGVIEPEPAMEEAIEEPSAERGGRMRQFLRRALLWLMGLLGVFALGVAATWFTQVTRLQREKASLQQEVVTVRAEAESQITSIREEHEAAVESLTQRLDEAELEIELLNALIDVSSAQVAFKIGDKVGVRAALAGTDDRLAMLQGELNPDGASAVKALRERLKTVLDELGSDADVVEEALERLSVNLLALERSLFGD
jgi:hypothetical protein